MKLLSSLLKWSNSNGANSPQVLKVASTALAILGCGLYVPELAHFKHAETLQGRMK